MPPLTVSAHSPLRACSGENAAANITDCVPSHVIDSLCKFMSIVGNDAVIGRSTSVNGDRLRATVVKGKRAGVTHSPKRTYSMEEQREVRVTLFDAHKDSVTPIADVIQPVATHNKTPFHRLVDLVSYSTHKTIGDEDLQAQAGQASVVVPLDALVLGEDGSLLWRVGEPVDRALPLLTLPPAYIVSVWPLCGESLEDIRSAAATAPSLTFGDFKTLLACCRRYLDHCHEVPHHGNWSGHSFVRRRRGFHSVQWVVSDFHTSVDANTMQRTETAHQRDAYFKVVQSSLQRVLEDLFGVDGDTSEEDASVNAAKRFIAVHKDEDGFIRPMPLADVKAQLHDALGFEDVSLRFPTYGAAAFVTTTTPLRGTCLSHGGGKGWSSAMASRRASLCDGVAVGVGGGVGAVARSEGSATPTSDGGGNGGGFAFERSASRVRSMYGGHAWDIGRLRDVSPAASDVSEASCASLRDKAERDRSHLSPETDLARRRKQLRDVLASDDDGARWVYRGLHTTTKPTVVGGGGGGVDVGDGEGHAHEEEEALSPQPKRAESVGDAAEDGDDGRTPRALLLGGDATASAVPQNGAYHDRFNFLMKKEEEEQRAAAERHAQKETEAAEAERKKKTEEEDIKKRCLPPTQAATNPTTAHESAVKGRGLRTLSLRADKNQTGKGGAGAGNYKAGGVIAVAATADKKAQGGCCVIS